MASLLRLVAVVATGLVALSFLMFAADQSQEGTATQVDSVEGSKGQVTSEAAIDVPSPEPSVEKAREAQHNGFREAVDDANDVLVAPFTGVTNSSNLWVARMVPAVLALLLYGVGGMLLANFLPKPKKPQTDWREATS